MKGEISPVLNEKLTIYGRISHVLLIFSGLNMGNKTINCNIVKYYLT